MVTTFTSTLRSHALSAATKEDLSEVRDAMIQSQISEDFSDDDDIASGSSEGYSLKDTKRA